jgi:HEAT repeat protein
MHQSTIDLLNEIILSEDNPNEFDDTLITIEKIQTEYLKTGQLNFAGEILNTLLMANNHLAKSHPQWQDKIKSALTMAGSKEKLDNIVPALNSRVELTGEEIIKYLNHFGWEALSAVTGILGELEHLHHRQAICQYLSIAGQEHIDIIARGVFDRRWFVVRNSAAILANIGGEKAMSYLTRAIGHDDSRVRLQVIKGLSEQNKGAELIAKLVWDNDELVRQAAMDALFEMNQDELLNAITNIINDDRFVSLAETEQEKLLITYSRLAGEQAVTYLTNFISKWGVTRNHAEDFYQEVAFKALGNNLSEKAEKALLKYNHSWNKKLRKLAVDALAHRRRLKYGGD